MMTPIIRAIACLATLLVAAAAAAPASPPPISDFVRRPEISRVSLSEDGRYLAFLTPGKIDPYDLTVQDLETRVTTRFDMKGDYLTSYEWIDSYRMIINIRPRPLFRFGRQILDVRQGKITDSLELFDSSMPFPETSVSGQQLFVISSLRRDPSQFMAWFSDFDTNRECLAVMRLKNWPSSYLGVNGFNARYNVRKLSDTPKGEFHGAYPDKDGEIRVLKIYREHEMRFYHRSTPQDSWKPLPLDAERSAILGFDDDPDYIYLVHSTDDGPTSRLHRYRVSTNELGPPIVEDPDYSLNEASLMSHWLGAGRSRVVALTYDRDIPVQRAIDPAFAEAQAAINARLPGRINLVQSCDRDLRRFVVASASGRETPRYAVYDRTAETLQTLPAPTPWLDPAGSSLMRPIKYPTRDGLMLEGYISLPANSGSAKPPLVVYAHPGPWARDTWGHDPTVQMLTSRGYAVFQPNYRGSVGYSRRISQDEEFAFRKMHDDVTDGVRYLIGLGLVDQKRLAIFGRGFGGFLAVAGAAFEPDLYRCAATYGGVFDWREMVEERRENPRAERYDSDRLLKGLGDPATRSESFRQISPLSQVAAIKAAVLVAYGEQDPRVDFRQSTRLLAALRTHRVRHAKLSFPNEDNGLPLDRENEQKLLETVERFLAKYL
ncbi:MAG TPA: prolyl oligopeptidase family serine peptidase [Lacunisphaera sp.]|nr:prolyl oligopeptidase family serine peptidase [Lacunisphaera sp.]